MLSPAHVARALEAERHSFAAYQATTARSLEHIRSSLHWLASLSRQELLALLKDHAHPGALPTDERHPGQAITRPLGQQWHSHREAQEWAAGRLQSVTTIGVDGSQITPTTDFSIPVGAVQVGWFCNPHTNKGRYVKDLRFEVLPPQELSPTQAGGNYPDVWVNLRRFQLECQVLVEQTQQASQRKGRALGFLDGSFIISFAAHTSPEVRQTYLESILAVLEVSEQTRIPVVGFVDNSQAHDLGNMLNLARQDDLMRRLPDGSLLNPDMQWGDRSEAWRCARDDGLFDEHPEQYYYDRVAFVYLKTTADNMPARLDIPAWVLDDGQLDWVVDMVRAECIAGTGYPYALQAADAVAVITTQDRERFYRLLQEYLDIELGLWLRYARKPYSKRIRR